jgi:hypothetical protein
MITKIINFLVFQIGWLIVVYLHNQKAAIICIFLAMFNYIISKQYSLRALIAAIVVTLLGTVNDYTLLISGIISFPDLGANIFPLWLVALWLLFISTFKSSLQWLQGLALIPLALLGGVGGAISYWAGTAVGAMQYHGTLPQLLLHFFNWLLLFPILYKLFWTISKPT